MDRNCDLESIKNLFGVSVAARGVWIEISFGSCTEPLGVVALRKESVDRNVT